MPHERKRKDHITCMQDIVGKEKREKKMPYNCLLQLDSFLLPQQKIHSLSKRFKTVNLLDSNDIAMEGDG